MASAKVIERCISQLVAEFRDCAMNFVQEADLESRLFSLLRDEPTMSIESEGYDVQLVHAQWPRVVADRQSGDSAKIAGWYDLAIWAPSSAKQPREYWGIGSLARAKEMRLYSVVEVKHRRSRTTPPNSPRDPWGKGDIMKLKHALRIGRAKWAYYLVFIDHDETAQNRHYFETMRKRLRRMRGRQQKLKILCASRSGSRRIWV